MVAPGARRDLRPHRPRRHGHPRPRRAARPAHGPARARRRRRHPAPDLAAADPQAYLDALACSSAAASLTARGGFGDFCGRSSAWADHQSLEAPQHEGRPPARPARPRSSGNRAQQGPQRRPAAPAGPAARRCRSGCRRRTPGAGSGRGSGRSGRGRRRRPGRGSRRRGARPPSRPARGGCRRRRAGSLAVRSNRCSGESWRSISSTRRATAAASATSTRGPVGSAVSHECRPLPNPLTLASCPALSSSTAVATSSRAESRSPPSRAWTRSVSRSSPGSARPVGGELLDVCGELGTGRARLRLLLGGAVDLVHLHDRLRPRAQRCAVGLGHARAARR